MHEKQQYLLEMYEPRPLESFASILVELATVDVLVAAMYITQATFAMIPAQYQSSRKASQEGAVLKQEIYQIRRRKGQI